MKIPKNILQDMNYLNLGEIRSLCDDLNIPYCILYEKNGTLKKTSTFDRKDVLLQRIRDFIETQKIPKPTILSSRIVNFTALIGEPQEEDPVFFGQFKHGHKGIDKLLKKISNGTFKDGAIARDVLRDYWTRGKTPSYKEFFLSWVKAVKKHIKPKEEWAYLTDLKAGHDMKKWKSLRKKKAEDVILYLKKLKRVASL